MGQAILRHFLSSVPRPPFKAPTASSTCPLSRVTERSGLTSSGQGQPAALADVLGASPLLTTVACTTRSKNELQRSLTGLCNEGGVPKSTSSPNQSSGS